MINIYLINIIIRLCFLFYLYITYMMRLLLFVRSTIMTVLRGRDFYHRDGGDGGDGQSKIFK